MYIIEVKLEGRSLPLYFRTFTKWAGIRGVKLTHSTENAKVYLTLSSALSIAYKIQQSRPSYQAVNVTPLVKTERKETS